MKGSCLEMRSGWFNSPVPSHPEEVRAFWVFAAPQDRYNIKLNEAM